MSSAENIRHSFAHLLAAAVGELYPGVKNTIGPAIENGFYYDFEFPAGKDGKSGAPSDKEFKDIEKRMRKILPSWKSFEGKEVSEAEAREIFKDNPYKLELISDIAAKGEKITLYTSGKFTDLCRGGHADPKDMHDDAFKIERIAGAYWRGDEKNAMLTRIYGLAFASKAELDAYVAQQEEAKKRDHKKLGPELDLFTFSDLVGAGLPLWTPRGTMLRHLLDGYVWSLRSMRGYEKVEIPHITKKDLYITSGHWEKYQNDLFKITTREGHEFAMKPMNCPHHTQIYARRLWSYKDLPQRYANTTTCYRDEQTGELSGLSRTRAFAQDDAHVFCRMADVKSEFLKIWDIINEFYPTFGFKLEARLSFHDPKQPEKYLGNKKRWETAEALLREIVDEKGVKALDGIGEAAFYGPKIDFMANDAIGRRWQVATIQLDMNMPERFDLSCVNEKGERERIVMIHAAIMGSLERFMSILIEHTGGNFPLWLAPTQVKIVPVRESNNARAAEVGVLLKRAGIRVDIDASDAGFGKKVREAKDMKIPYTVIIGDKDMEKGVVTLESRDKGKVGEMKAEEAVAMLSAEAAEKK
ncbi:MAG TPA: threonine--tRNA ligase [Candidatus Paceibacterota bacterium]|nr:threonine--tRNA ligase [Candidatus Paceibacterota bacterium]